MFATGPLQHLMRNSMQDIRDKPCNIQVALIFATERRKTCSSKCWNERRITKPCPSAKSVCKDLGRWGVVEVLEFQKVTDIIRYQVSLPHQAWMHQ